MNKPIALARAVVFCQYLKIGHLHSKERRIDHMWPYYGDAYTQTRDTIGREYYSGRDGQMHHWFSLSEPARSAMAYALVHGVSGADKCVKDMYDIRHSTYDMAKVNERLEEFLRTCDICIHAVPRFDQGPVNPENFLVQFR